MNIINYWLILLPVSLLNDSVRFGPTPRISRQNFAQNIESYAIVQAVSKWVELLLFVDVICLHWPHIEVAY